MTEHGQGGEYDRRLNRVILHEEFVALVNAYCHAPPKKKVSAPYITAILLSQLLYWETRCRDYDSFRIEEHERLERFAQGREQRAEAQQPPVLTHGWIYKSAQELSEETMLGVADSTILLHLRRLLSIGVLEKRNNPNYHWDRRLQYRVNTIRLRQLLFAIGYNLEGWPILPEEYRLADIAAPPFSKTGDAFLKIENASPKIKNQTAENQKSNCRKSKIELPKFEDRTAQIRRAISETTTEITTEITTEREPEHRNETITSTSSSAVQPPLSHDRWESLAETPQGKDLIAVYESSVHPIRDVAERDALMELMQAHGSARVQVALWRAQTLGRQDLFPCMRDFLLLWKDLERRNQNGKTNGAGSRRADSSAADRPLSHEEQNELRRLELRERALSGHYTEADAREAERLLYC